MRSRRGDEGVTLVELLLGVAILATIIPALTGSLVIGWRTTDTTVATLSDSRSRAITASLFVRDVQSARQVDTVDATRTCMLTGDRLLVRVAIDTPDATGTLLTSRAAWVLTPAAQVERRQCDDGTNVASSVRTAYDVSGTPAVACDGNTMTCPVASRVVRMTVVTTNEPSAPFSVTGRRRAS